MHDGGVYLIKIIALTQVKQLTYVNMLTLYIYIYI